MGDAGRGPSSLPCSGRRRARLDCARLFAHGRARCCAPPCAERSRRRPANADPRAVCGEGRLPTSPPTLRVRTSSWTAPPRSRSRSSSPPARRPRSHSARPRSPPRRRHNASPSPPRRPQGDRRADRDADGGAGERGAPRPGRAARGERRGDRLARRAPRALDRAGAAGTPGQPRHAAGAAAPRRAGAGGAGLPRRGPRGAAAALVPHPAGGELAVEAGGLEAPPKLLGPREAAGPLRAHTLAVNEVGIAFLRAARERGEECGPHSWRPTRSPTR